MENNNLLLAIILSILILAGFQYFFAQPQHRAEPQMQVQKLVQDIRAENAAASNLRDRAAIIKDDPRIPIISPELSGSVDLKGARFDDLTLTRYRETVEPNSPPVTLLSPTDSAAPYLAYYAELGWLADAGTAVPSDDTIWKAESNALTPQQPLKLIWDNGHGLVFERVIELDDQYMFTVTDHVRNAGAAAATLYPFGLVMHQGNPAKSPSRVLHEGPLGVLDGTLQEYTYKELMSGSKRTADSDGGWLGITDKYWMVALVVPGSEKFTADFSYNAAGATDPLMGDFQTDFRAAPLTIAPGASADHKMMLFAGAKRQNLLEHYQDKLSIPLFDRAIDFGWFWFLTIPFLHLLSFLSRTLGSFAAAILVFTVCLKLVTLPLSLKSNHSMSRMRLLQPEMQRIKERYADDKVKQSQEMMELYKREGINPLAGCVPTLIQIPIFFALYKVIYIGIEMRQAPFFGWVKDLSAPDPSSVFTLFGLIHWAPPLALQIGVWPVLMGCSMFLQQRMSPQPPDRSQARMFMLMPLLFTYMLRSMPVGLVIYWTWSNLLSIAQQWYIMRQDLKRRGKLGKV